MNNEFNLEDKYEIKDYVPFLEKERVQLGTNFVIKNIKKGVNERRPLLIGEFSFGVFAFDMPIVEYIKLVEAYGSTFGDWIGKEVKIKANPWSKKNKKGLSLEIKILDV